MSVGYLVHGFDLLNVGDLDLIAQAGSRCTRLVAGVLTDDQVRQLYGRPPVVPLPERMALVQRVRGVAEVRAHGGGVDLPDRAIVFVPAAEPSALQLPDAAVLAEVVALPRRRQTRSPVVQAALTSSSPVAS